jgi:pantothenate synthetase
LHRSLKRVQELVDRGERNVARLVAAGRAEFEQANSVRLDYFELVNPDALDPIDDISAGALAAVAAFVGNTRLIDNILLEKLSAQ